MCTRIKEYSEWIVNNRRHLLWLYNGMHIVIRDCAVVATFKDGFEARKWAASKFADGDWTYIHCTPMETANNTITILR